MNKNAKKLLEQEAARLNKTYGQNTAVLGSTQVKLKVHSTGILALDYALGTGGWAKGYCYEVFGPEDIGKSSAIGLSAIRGVQADGGLAAVIAVEPGWDDKWVARNGVNGDHVLITRPDNAEDAFNMLFDFVENDLIDLIVFDSIGALLKGTEIDNGKEGDKRAKPSAMGQAGLITWGVKRCVMPAYKRQKTIIYLNQVRDVTSSQYDMLESPGGHALKHSVPIRLQLKPGSKKETATIDGTSGVIVNRDIIAEVVRNKLNEGTKQRGIFKFNQKDWEGSGVGVDRVEDIIRTGKKCGVIEGTSYFESSLWEGKLHGRKAVAKHFEENPQVYLDLRDQIIDVMIKRQGDPNFKVTPEEIEEATKNE